MSAQAQRESLILYELSILSQTDSMFSFGSKSQNSEDIVVGEFRKIRKNFFKTHTGSQPAKHIVNTYAHATNTRLSKPLG